MRQKRLGLSFRACVSTHWRFTVGASMHQMCILVLMALVAELAVNKTAFFLKQISFSRLQIWLRKRDASETILQWRQLVGTCPERVRDKRCDKWQPRPADSQRMDRGGRRYWASEDSTRAARAKSTAHISRKRNQSNRHTNREPGRASWKPADAIRKATDGKLERSRWQPIQQGPDHNWNAGEPVAPVCAGDNGIGESHSALQGWQIYWIEVALPPSKKLKPTVKHPAFWRDTTSFLHFFC